MSEKDEIRAAKRNRGMVHVRETVYDDPDYPLQSESHVEKYTHLSGVPGGSGAPHAPMKHESEVIRRAMAETGRTEEDLRTDPHYRKLFSEAQAVVTKRTPRDRKMDELIKSVTRDLKLALAHPAVELELRKRFFERKHPLFQFWGYRNRTTITMDDCIARLHRRIHNAA